MNPYEENDYLINIVFYLILTISLKIHKNKFENSFYMKD